MIFILGAALFFLSGYAVVYLFGLSRNDILCDLPLGWFFGLGYYGLGMLVYYYFFRENAGSTSSLIILMIPILLAFIRYGRSLSGKADMLDEEEYFGSGVRRKLNRLEKGMLLFSLAVFLLICIHGSSTPVNSDDALRVRAYHSIMVYKSEPMFAKGEMFDNGPLSNYTPQLLWQLNGGVE